MKRPNAERIATPLLTVGGIAAAFGLASCCALPFFLAGLGLGSAWLGGIALYAAFHRPEFIALAVVGLTGSALLVWRQRKTIKSTALWLAGTSLAVGIALLYLGLTYV